MVLVDPFDHRRGFRIGCGGKGDFEGSMGGWESLKTKFGRMDRGWAKTLINQI